VRWSPEDDGFKVIAPQPGLKDEELKRKARGWAILTQNSQDFVHDAVRYDYDVIGIEDFKFRKSQLYSDLWMMNAAVRPKNG
jgi:hypothetical protein